MRMIPTLSVALVLGACTPDATRFPTASDSPLEARAAASGLAERPLGGRCETQFDPPPFPLPAVHRQVDSGVCQLAHLGRATMRSVQEIEFATGRQTGIAITFTAANGDELHATSVGTSVPGGSGVRFVGVMTFAGGTGRFANAGGRARVEGEASFSTNTASFSLSEGTITY